MNTNLHPGSSDYDIIHEGFSTITRTWITSSNRQPTLVVVKSASISRKFSKEPHDIVKESRLLSAVKHPNVVPIFETYRDETRKVLSFRMPYLPFSLSDLLDSPDFSPHPLPEPDALNQSHEDLFSIIVKGIMVQVFSAFAFLHHPSRQIAHRDLKPQNVMFSKEGCVKLIDFGVAYQHDEVDADKSHDIWPEYAQRLYFEVSTGPYRAPELLFGARHYDPIALDLWSLGACLAEFFTPLRLHCDEMDEDETLQEEEEIVLNAFVVPESLRVDHPDSYWKRDTLFNGSRGEIGVAWSIFKIFGTPTEDSWPGYENLPNSQSLVFNIVPSVPLAPLLPNLPSSSTSDASAVVDILVEFLKYPPSSRLSAEDALLHAWVTSGPAICLPHDYTFDHGIVVCHEYDGMTFGEILVSEFISPTK